MYKHILLMVLSAVCITLGDDMQLLVQNEVILDEDQPMIWPSIIKVHGDEIFVGDRALNNIRRFELKSGAYLGTVVDFGSEGMSLTNFDVSEDYIVCSDMKYSGGGRVLIYRRNGEYLGGINDLFDKYYVTSLDLCFDENQNVLLTAYEEETYERLTADFESKGQRISKAPRAAYTHMNSVYRLDPRNFTFSNMEVKASDYSALDDWPTEKGILLAALQTGEVAFGVSSYPAIFTSGKGKNRTIELPSMIPFGKNPQWDRPTAEDIATRNRKNVAQRDLFSTTYKGQNVLISWIRVKGKENISSMITNGFPAKGDLSSVRNVICMCTTGDEPTRSSFALIPTAKGSHPVSVDVELGLEGEPYLYSLHADRGASMRDGGKEFKSKPKSKTFFLVTHSLNLK